MIFPDHGGSNESAANSRRQWQHHLGHPWPDFSQPLASLNCSIAGNSSNTTSAIRGLTFHKSMLRKSEKVDEVPETAADAAVDASERRKAGARRTAWILAAIAAGFFIASLFEGHFVQIPH